MKCTKFSIWAIFKKKKRIVEKINFSQNLLWYILHISFFIHFLKHSIFNFYLGIYKCSFFYNSKVWLSIYKIFTKLSLFLYFNKIEEEYLMIIQMSVQKKFGILVLYTNFNQKDTAFIKFCHTDIFLLILYWESLKWSDNSYWFPFYKNFTDFLYAKYFIMKKWFLILKIQHFILINKICSCFINFINLVYFSYFIIENNTFHFFFSFSFCFYC